MTTTRKFPTIPMPYAALQIIGLDAAQQLRDAGFAVVSEDELMWLGWTEEGDGDDD